MSGAWCWTEDRLAVPVCGQKGHDVRPYRGMATPVPDGDPSVETWRETLGESTSAKLRRTEAELGSALRRLAEVQEQRDQASALSVELLRDTERLRAVEAERDRLRAMLNGYGYAV